MASKRTLSSSCHEKALRTCTLCSEETNIHHMLSLHDCEHKFCVYCAKNHAEVKLREGPTLPKCPKRSCKSSIKMRKCKKVLKPELVKLLKERLKESRIPVQERIYCPNPKCSYLMSKANVLAQSEGGKEKRKGKKADKSRYRRKCLKCGGKFCVECQVSWHYDMTCCDYKKLNPYSCAEEQMLSALAKNSAWIQCINCGHMIELASGCDHITCRCGCKLCYGCGSWKKTCNCSSFDSSSSSSDSDSD